MQDITENVAQSKGMDLGGHTPVLYLVDDALLAFDNRQDSFNQGDMTKPEWSLLCQLPGAVVSLCVDS